MSCTASYLISFSTRLAGESQLMRRNSKNATSNQVVNRFSNSASRAKSRLLPLSTGSSCARRSTRKRMPSGNTAKRWSKRVRGDTRALRKRISATPSSGVPTAASYCSRAALTLLASGANCSLISSQQSSRCSGVALLYHWATPRARLPPSTSLTLGSTIACNSIKVRRKTRGDKASSFWRKVALSRSREERTSASLPTAGLVVRLSGLLSVVGALLAPWRLPAGSQPATVRPIHSDVFMLKPRACRVLCCRR